MPSKNPMIPLNVLQKFIEKPVRENISRLVMSSITLEPSSATAVEKQIASRTATCR